MHRHPPKFAGLERRVAFFRARIIDAMGVEGSRFPYWRCDFCHAHAAAELLRNLGERLVTFLQAIVAANRGYSITSSASASNLSGTSTPSIRAVGWLMTSSNFAACTTGRSAVFAP